MLRRYLFLPGCILLAGAFVDHGQVHARGDQSGAFAALVEQYVVGDADAAVQDLAGWDAGRLAREARLDPQTTTDPWTAAAMVMLHREAFGWVGQGPRWEHKRAMVQGVRDLVFPQATAGADRALLAFCIQWYDVTLPRVDRAFFEDTRFVAVVPEMLLMRGRYLEHWMGPAVEWGGWDGHAFAAAERPLVTTSHGRFGTNAPRAIETFRQVIERAPHLVEARLRLGRVLYLMDRRDEAERELGQAIDEARTYGDIATAYRAAVLLGRVHEDAGRPGEAEAAYRLAMSIYPRFPSAALALSRIVAQDGRDRDASALVLDLFAHADEDGAVATDPTGPYALGVAAWTETQQLRALRAMVRARR